MGLGPLMGFWASKPWAGNSGFERSQALEETDSDWGSELRGILSLGFWAVALKFWWKCVSVAECLAATGHKCRLSGSIDLLYAFDLPTPT